MKQTTKQPAHAKGEDLKSLRHPESPARSSKDLDLIFSLTNSDPSPKMKSALAEISALAAERRKMAA